MTAAVMVGVDVGTTRIKAVVVGLDGTEQNSAAVPTPWRVEGARAEADPMEFLSATKAVIAGSLDAYRATSPDAHIVGVGVTGMAESGVLLDASDEPVAPVIAWHDPRGAMAQVAESLPDFDVRTGMAMGPVSSLMKLPMLLAMSDGRGARWLNVPEWIVFGLGGDQFSEISLASRTGLYDLHARQWWPEAFAFLGVGPELMPSTPAVGSLGAGTATFEPIAGATVVVAGHDHQVAAYGEGAIGSHSLFDSLGTAEAIVRTIGTVPAPGDVARLTAQGVTVGATVVPDHWAILAGFRSGQILERISKLLGLASREERSAVSTLAATLVAHETLRVERDDESVAIVGITDDASPAHLWRAAVDYADVRVGQALAELDEMFGAATDVTICGGWLNDPTVLAAKSARFPNFRTAGRVEAGAAGAAVMAAVAAGELDGPFRTDHETT